MGSLFQELNRRKVFRVAAVYAKVKKVLAPVVTTGAIFRRNLGIERTTVVSRGFQSICKT